MNDNFGTWRKQALLGQGGFGEVWKVVTDKGAVLAAKYINSSDARTSLGKAEHEVRFLKQLSHANIVKFAAVKADGDQLIVFTEMIDGSDLVKLCPIQSEAELRGYLKQISSALSYMHSCSPPVLHRDIKGENIMVTRDGTVKLIDFGISINLMVASGMSASEVIFSATSGCGTYYFMAPELFSDRSQFSVKSDVWALGITILQLLSGQRLFQALWPNSTGEIIDRITGQGAPELPTNLGSERLASFYACCTAPLASDRKSTRELLQHSFLA